MRGELRSLSGMMVEFVCDDHHTSWRYGDNRQLPWQYSAVIATAVVQPRSALTLHSLLVKMGICRLMGAFEMILKRLLR